MGDPPLKGAVQVNSTFSLFTVVVGVAGVSGIAAALIVNSEVSTLNPLRFLAYSLKTYTLFGVKLLAVYDVVVIPVTKVAHTPIP